MTKEKRLVINKVYDGLELAILVIAIAVLLSYIIKSSSIYQNYGTTEAIYNLLKGIIYGAISGLVYEFLVTLQSMNWDKMLEENNE